MPRPTRLLLHAALVAVASLALVTAAIAASPPGPPSAAPPVKPPSSAPRGEEEPGGSGAPAPRVAADVRDAVAARGFADVVVTFRDGWSPADGPATTARLVADARAGVLSSLPPGSFSLRTTYEQLPLVAGSLDAVGLAVLESSDAVVAVESDDWLRPVAIESARSAPRRAQYLAEAVPLVGADYVHRELGLTGRGIGVAVLDTGIDNDHGDFAGRIVEQYCYSSSRSCAPNNVAEGPSAEDEAGHGTAVTGILAGGGAVSSIGMAPGASIVMVRVFRDAGGAQTSDIIKGLDFVLRKQLAHNIRVVNMSLGGGAGRGTNCDDQNTDMKSAFQRLVSRNVAIFVATGNNNLRDEVSSPGCISNSTAVGATYDADFAVGFSTGLCRQTNVTPLTIACFTNRGRAMDILAPGIFIATSKMGGGVTAPGAGTSYAAPMAAGLAALMLEADPSLRPAEVERIMQQTGRDVKHLETSDVFELIDARKAVERVLAARPTPVRSATSTASPATATPTRTAASATPVSPTPRPSGTSVATAPPTTTPPGTPASPTATSEASASPSPSPVPATPTSTATATERAGAVVYLPRSSR